AQIWTEDFHLLLDGPAAGRAELERAALLLCCGGRFGYRFQYPPMCIGRYELYWHRPLVACQAARSRRATVVADAPLGYFTARSADRPAPAEILWPRLLRRGPHAAALELLASGDDLLNVRKLLNVHELAGTAL